MMPVTVPRGGVKYDMKDPASVIDKEQHGLCKGPGNIEGLATDRANFAPYVVRLENKENAMTHMNNAMRRPIDDPRYPFNEVYALHSESSFGDTDGHRPFDNAKEGFEHFFRNKTAYLRMTLKKKPSGRWDFGLFSSGLTREADCKQQAVYVSHKGALTSLHYDTNGVGIIYQLKNRKTVFLFPPEATESLRRCSGTLNYRRSGFDGDFDDPDTVSEYSQSSDWQMACQYGVKVVLEPGDALVTPMFWWHAVKSEDDLTISLITRLKRGKVDFRTFPFAREMMPTIEEEFAASKKQTIENARRGPFSGLISDAQLEQEWQKVSQEESMNRARDKARVMLRDLKAAKELNGQYGELIEWISSKERYRVKIDGLEEIKSVKPANLVKLEL